MYLVQVSLLLIGQQGLGHFFSFEGGLCNLYVNAEGNDKYISNHSKCNTRSKAI
jgi:hypothetical protein